jgi:hypothetical protein
MGIMTKIKRKDMNPGQLTEAGNAIKSELKRVEALDLPLECAPFLQEYMAALTKSISDFARKEGEVRGDEGRSTEKLLARTRKRLELVIEEITDTGFATAQQANEITQCLLIGTTHRCVGQAPDTCRQHIAAMMASPRPPHARRWEWSMFLNWWHEPPEKKEAA